MDRDRPSLGLASLVGQQPEVTSGTPASVGIRSRASRRASPGTIVVPAVSLAVALGMVAALSPAPAVEAFACMIAFGLFAIWAIRAESLRWGWMGVASPLSLYAVFWFLYYGVFGLGSFNQPTVEALIGYEQRELLAADWLAFGSLLLVSAAYLVTTRLRPPGLLRERTVQQGDVRPWAIYVCLFAGWVATIYAYERGQVGYVTVGAVYSGLANHILQATTGLVILGLVALAYVAWAEQPVTSMTRRHAKVLLVVNVPLLAGTSLASGLKAQLVTDLIPVGVMYLVLRRRLPWRAILLVALYLVLSYAGVQQFRQQVETGQVTAGKSGGLVGLVHTVGSDVLQSRPTADPASSARAFWDHFTQEENLPQVMLAAILHDTPGRVPRASATRLLTGPVFFLPTSWLPDGSFNSGQYVSVTYSQSTASSSAPDPQPGDFYMSGGLPLVVIGELVIGVLLGFVWRYVLSSRVTGRRLIIYCVIAGSLANAGLDWVGLTRFILQTMIVYALVSRVLVCMDPRNQAMTLETNR